MSDQVIGSDVGLGWPTVGDADADSAEPGQTVGLGWPE
jgi:hypothetical protein